MIIFLRLLISGCIIVIILQILSGCESIMDPCASLAGTADYNLCLAEHGSKDAQYELGLAAYEAGDMDEAIKWLEKAAKPRDMRTPIFIPTGGDNFRMEMRETGLSEEGHSRAKRLLEEISSEGRKE